MTQPIPSSRVVGAPVVGARVVVARVVVPRGDIKGAGGLACLAFAAVLGGAFWIGALLASHHLIH